MLVPTWKLVLILLLPAVLMFVWQTPAGVAAGLAFDGFVVLLALTDLLISPGPRQLELWRHLPGFLSLGADNTVGWNVRNLSNTILKLELTDDLPDGMLRDQPRLAVRVVPRGNAELRYKVRPAARGLYEFGDVHVRCATALGLLVRQRRLRLRSQVKIYPNVVNLSRYELTLQRHRTAMLGLTAVRQRGRGNLFESLREYVPGDDWGDVAWKATARRGRLITRNYEAERSQNILVMLDCGRLMTPLVGRVSRLDYAIDAVLLLTYVAMKQGDSIGLLAFHDQIAAYVPPVRGKRAIGRMNEALYRIEPSLAESNYDRACRFLALRYRKRSLIVILTDVIDRDASALLLGHAARFARQHLPVCVTLRDLELEQFAQAPPVTPRDCYTKAVALQTLERRTEALVRMRRSGVDVLDADPRTLTPTVVNRYLWLKERRRL